RFVMRAFIASWHQFARVVGSSSARARWSSLVLPDQPSVSALPIPPNKNIAKAIGNGRSSRRAVGSVIEKTIHRLPDAIACWIFTDDPGVRVRGRIFCRSNHE